jgi:hypothetical protein
MAETLDQARRRILERVCQKERVPPTSWWLQRRLLEYAALAVEAERERLREAAMTLHTIRGRVQISVVLDLLTSAEDRHEPA